MTGRSKEETADITLLGNQKTQYPCDYAPEMLETFENKHQGNDYFVKFNCPEFTSLCPILFQAFHNYSKGLLIFHLQE